MINNMSSLCPECEAHCDHVILGTHTSDELGCDKCLHRMPIAEYLLMRAQQLMQKAEKDGVPAGELIINADVPETCPHCGERILGVDIDVDVYIDADGEIVACGECTYEQDVYDYAVSMLPQWSPGEEPWGEDLGPCKYDEGVL